MAIALTPVILAGLSLPKVEGSDVAGAVIITAITVAALLAIRVWVIYRSRHR